MKKQREISYALVTGASYGIGLSLMQKLSKTHHVIAVSRTKGKLVEVNATNISHWQYDLACNSERAALIERLEKSIPYLDILVNNAGVQHELGLDISEWNNLQQEIEVNLVAPIHLTSGLNALLCSATKPIIINIGSVLGFSHRKVSPIYSVTKAAIHQFSKVLHQDNKNISVLTVIPPMVASNMTKSRNQQGLMSADVLTNLIIKNLNNTGFLYVGKAKIARWLSMFAPRLLNRMINGQN